MLCRGQDDLELVADGDSCGGRWEGVPRSAASASHAHARPWAPSRVLQLVPASAPSVDSHHVQTSATTPGLSPALDRPRR